MPLNVNDLHVQSNPNVFEKSVAIEVFKTRVWQGASKRIREQIVPNTAIHYIEHRNMNIRCGEVKNERVLD